MENAYRRICPAVPGRDIVLDMLFDEGAGQQVLDASGCRNHGTLVNMNEADWVIDGPYGRGFALDFDGVNDYVQVNSVAAGGFFGGAFTLSGRGKLAAWGANQTILAASRLGATTPYALIGFNNPDQRLYARVDTPTNPENSVPSLAVYTNDSDWHYFVMVVNAAGHIIAFYIDGIYQGADAANAHDLSAIDGFYIGQLPWNVPNINPWNGRVSEVMILNRLSAASEARHLCDQPRARYGSGLESMGLLAA